MFEKLLTGTKSKMESSNGRTIEYTEFSEWLVKDGRGNVLYEGKDKKKAVEIYKAGRE
jgi:hypothetical protein